MICNARQFCLLLLTVLILSATTGSVLASTDQLTIKPRVRLVLANCTVQPRDTLDKIFARVKVGRFRDQIQLDGPAAFFPVIENLNPWIKRRGIQPEGRSVTIFFPEARPPQHCRIINHTVYAGGKPYRVRYDLVYMRKNQSLSFLLTAEGVGAKGSGFRINGPGGFLLRTKVLNPHVTDWNRVPVGTPIVLAYPERVPFLSGAPDKLTLQQRAAIQEKIATGNIAKLDDKLIEQIPQEVKQEKAWEYSFLDSLDKDVNRFVNKAEAKGPSAYLGLRIAQSLVYSDPLLKDTRFVGLLFEGRGAWTDGFRLYYDRFAEAETVTEEGAQNAKMFRVLAAKSFAVRMPWIFDAVHITPRVGAYSMSARLPAGSDLAGNPILKDFGVENALAAGLELDAEWSTFFYILRFWAARDVPLRDGQASVTSRRFGFDAFIKGGGFSLFERPMSLSWLFFIADERLNLKSKPAGAEVYTINLPIPYAGLGASIAW